MKSCPVCGLIQDESCLFCPEDGSALTDDNALGFAGGDDGRKVERGRALLPGLRG